MLPGPEVSTRSKLSPSRLREPLCAHSAPAPDKTVRPNSRVRISEVRRSTPSLIVTRPTTGSSSSSAGDLIAIRFDVGRPTGIGNRWRAGAVSQVVRPPNPRQTLHQGLLYKWALRWGIQINSERHTQEIKIMWVRKITTYFCSFAKFLVKLEINTMSS
jgi:hypothetical protein